MSRYNVLLEAANRVARRRARATSVACRREHFATWHVVQRHGNASAFNGYHWTPSSYSCVRCGTCGRAWRTKAAYVEGLPDVSTE